MLNHTFDRPKEPKRRPVLVAEALNVAHFWYVHGSVEP